MSVELRMPLLNPGMEKGIVVAWLASVGQAVARGEPLVQVESDKAVLDVESPVDGRLARIAQPKGSTVVVGELLGVIE